MNLSKKTKQIYEPANMSKNESIKATCNELPKQTFVLVAEVLYTFNN